MPIVIDHVSYEYAAGSPQAVYALRDINVQIEDGEFVGIMGRTGCGKSTLIQLIGGLLTPMSGRILVDGGDINAKHYDTAALHEKIGMVFQYPEMQLFETTVEKDVAFGLKHSGLSKTQIQNQVRWALEACGFDYETIRHKAPVGLSGGEKRRVAIAGVIVTKPRYLLLDEPIAGLDPLGRDAFLQLITKLNKERMTILMVSHNADAIGEYTDRLLVLDEGKLACDGPTTVVFSDLNRMEQLHLGVSASRRLASLLSEKGMPIPQDICSYQKLLSALSAQLKGGDPA